MIWDLGTGKRIKKLTGHRYIVISLSRFLPSSLVVPCSPPIFGPFPRRPSAFALLWSVDLALFLGVFPIQGTGLHAQLFDGRPHPGVGRRRQHGAAVGLEADARPREWRRRRGIRSERNARQRRSRWRRGQLGLGRVRVACRLGMGDANL